MCAQHVRVCVRVCLISMWMLHAKKTNENPKSAFTNKVNCASILVTQIFHDAMLYFMLNSSSLFAYLLSHTTVLYWIKFQNGILLILISSEKKRWHFVTVWIRKNMYKWLDLYMHWALVLGEKICASNEKGTENIFQQKRSRRCYFNSIPLRAHAKNERKFMKYSYRTKWMRKRVALTLSHTLWYSHGVAIQLNI